ncbi:MAG: 30S ribosomal protein S16 [Candidatus Margulisiibacteriota bacterium]|nr:MAG: 30S ribosomal protein S16 [Candidatus Margulisbacteria bacterium GWD2_39_127]OGI03059.1 MAG: 30S ribosomal protein S16 [Candidatus Margulisbacteria bacterium GWF2_38_17]OGI11612.1 MAG: 30S ribosomal protein S16 [Candidatus Margulisbacteria bacterium GWE2_39_32]PZM79920.1 MAG: 30S ribosomal protein S16 [Candidatus Margulisiibacteriota bacterium]HAR62838.1 30S ribosomal protein S16 [Candidatus Margulisiibacteriota bacterium]
MAVKIRLKRFGKKKDPIYRVVVQDSHVQRDGKVIEQLGQYAPKNDPVVFNVDVEKVKSWIGKGAQPTVTVARLLGNAGIISKPVRTAKKPPKKQKA